jgi:hypothetical protein
MQEKSVEGVGGIPQCSSRYYRQHRDFVMRAIERMHPRKKLCIIDLCGCRKSPTYNNLPPLVLRIHDLKSEGASGFSKYYDMRHTYLPSYSM